MTNQESLAKSSKELILKEPFYGLLLMSLNKIWDKKIVSGGHPTAGVCINRINYELRIHPEFWEGLTPIQRLGILKHELLHIGFFHLTDYKEYLDKKVLNIAMDIEINQYIDRTWLPKEGCFLENFDGLGLEEKKGTRYYYKKLMEKQKANDETVSKLCQAMADGESSCELPNGQTVQLPEHDWKEMEAMDDATHKLIEAQTKHIVTQVADQVVKGRGTVPGEFAELIERLNHIDPPKFDWKGYMRRFVGTSIKTYTRKSRRKYNTRMPDNPGLKIKRHNHVLAAIDTSASVSTNELKEFLAELYHMNKTGSDITIIQCDTAISNISKFNPRKDLDIHGRGGTDFQPVIDYYNEKQREYSCLFYFTDGEAPAPDNAKGSILWVLSEQSGMNENLPGKVIKLEL